MNIRLLFVYLYNKIHYKTKNMATVNLNQVICISLKSHNESQLDAIGATYNIALDSLIKAKNDGCKRLWVHIGGGVVIAGLDTDNIEDVYFSPEYLPMTAKVRKSILAIKPVKTPKMPKSSKVVIENVVDVNIDSLLDEVFSVLDIDSILDKISAKGMSSLTKKELEFLEKSSK